MTDHGLSEPGNETVVDLAALSSSLLEKARRDPHGKASAQVLRGGHQRAVLIAMAAGAALGEHASPQAASLHVLSGRFHLSSGEPAWMCGTGTLVAIPPERHAVDCLEDGAFLLTISL